MDKKTVAIIPIKSRSERVKDKNFRILNNVPLYENFLNKLKKCDFDEIYVDTDSQIIKDYCLKNNFSVIDRLASLSKDDANGNDLLLHHSSIIDADYYFQLFITSPLLTTNTINSCISFILQNDQFDSIFTATEIYSWFWYKNKPVNYNPKELPRSQNAIPVIRETTGLYGIKKSSLLNHKCRIGSNPYNYIVDDIEAVDLDTEFDFEVAEYYLKNLKGFNGY
jgi:CMP-N-acetylneuraminic acid synthetase